MPDTDDQKAVSGTRATDSPPSPSARETARSMSQGVITGGMRRSAPPLLPGVLLGIGLGGFADGIVLHQILQWHHMLTAEGCCPSTSVVGLEDNTLADGFFHAATWVAVVAGSTLAVRAWQRRQLAPPGRFHFGALLLGWGLFNVVEGLIDHQILGIHHVRDDLGAPIGWDIGFLVFGALQVALGLAMIASGNRLTSTEARATAERS